MESIRNNTSENRHASIQTRIKGATKMGINGINSKTYRNWNRRLKTPALRRPKSTISDVRRC